MLQEVHVASVQRTPLLHLDYVPCNLIPVEVLQETLIRNHFLELLLLSRYQLVELAIEAGEPLKKPEGLYRILHLF